MGNTEKKTKGTVKIGGVNYQTRYVRCGKACPKCRDGGEGHFAVFRYVPLAERDTRNAWKYFGPKLPEPVKGKEKPTCQREGCTNEVQRLGQKYCSGACRQAVYRAKFAR